MFSKDTVESQLDLSIKSMKRLGMLRPGYHGSLIWRSCKTKEEKSRISVTCQPHKLILSYKSRSYGQDWESVRDTIYLAETNPNYGGSRYWFICPSCQARRTNLYGGKYFRCRICRDLCYESQLESGWNLIMSRMYKIRHRLGDYNGLDHWFPPKPKGMRWKTYNALQERYDALDRQLTLGWMRRLGMYSDLL